MPTIVRIGAFRLFFFSNENQEPPHVHVESGDALAKFWLDPEIAYADSIGFSAKELGYISRIVAEHRELCIRRWHEHFDPQA